MENRYWLGRNRSSIAMARDALTSESRLIHYDLAGRYSIQAAQCVAFEQSTLRHSASGQRATLHLPEPALAGSVRQSLPPSESDRRMVDAGTGEGR